MAVCTSLAQDSRRRALVCLPLGQAPAGTVGGALFSGALCPPPCSQKHPGLTPFQLSLQSNRLTKIEGLQSLVNLRELYLSHNGIEVIEGLDNNVRAELCRRVGHCTALWALGRFLKSKS